MIVLLSLNVFLLFFLFFLPRPFTNAKQSSDFQRLSNEMCSLDLLNCFSYSVEVNKQKITIYSVVSI